MIVLAPQTWQQVRNQWGWVEIGLQAILARTQERWMPLDVWSALQANNSFLYTIQKDGDDVGFLVLRTVQDCDGPYLFIWCLWSEPDAMRDCYREVLGKLDELAARVGARRIRMESPREAWGWGSMFDPVATIYEREVTL